MGIRTGRPPKNRTGERVGRLVAVRYEVRGAYGGWVCQCDCGNEAWVHTTSFQKKDAHSCGCFANERRKVINKTHGMSYTKTYASWDTMKGRCYYPGDISYPRYGGKGIAVCERWHNFDNFLADMGLRPDGCTLDRLDNSKDYSKENCRWSTYKVQANNRTNNRRVTVHGETLTVSGWAEKTGLRADTISKRLAAGWDETEAILTPVSRKA